MPAAARWGSGHIGHVTLVIHLFNKIPAKGKNSLSSTRAAGRQMGMAGGIRHHPPSRGGGGDPAPHTPCGITFGRWWGVVGGRSLNMNRCFQSPENRAKPIKVLSDVGVVDNYDHIECGGAPEPGATKLEFNRSRRCAWWLAKGTGFRHIGAGKRHKRTNGPIF
jgi:hypothetical protein